MPIHAALFYVCGALLVALTVYVLTGGADYGSGVWDLLASGPRAAAQRELIERAIGPVWEADHVWLILIIVILFNAFPPVFAAITTAMHIPLTLMLIGIVLRGSSFSFRSYGGGPERTQIRWERMFSIASLVTPLLLGVIIGAIASGRIPKDPRGLGDFVWPWMTPFCFAVGIFALVLFAHLAAIYATLEPADAEVRDDFRLRALATGIAVGVIAGIVLLLSIHGAPRIWAGLTERVWTWPLVWITSILAIAALYSLWTRRFEIARACAVGHVALIVWGWAFAQFPYILEPDLDIYNAAAPPITLDILAGALTAGALILFPSFWYLKSVFKSHREHRHLWRRHGSS
jgi:cytochrome bd ubiquinol oxidase subunit II